MNRKKHKVKVDFGSHEDPKSDPHDERVRYLWTLLDQVQYPLRELLVAEGASRQGRWLRELKVRHARLGRAIEHFKVQAKERLKTAKPRQLDGLGDELPPIR